MASRRSIISLRFNYKLEFPRFIQKSEFLNEHLPNDSRDDPRMRLCSDFHCLEQEKFRLSEQYIKPRPPVPLVNLHCIGVATDVEVDNQTPQERFPP